MFLAVKWRHFHHFKILGGVVVVVVGGVQMGGGGELGYCRGSVWNGCSEGMCDADDCDVDGDCGG